ncbi:uncharacterized protein N7515_009279 [Penicillium bovifimosum]|uniref:Uncharacterized protein n=1 Tax=Penicillium bovifimosum TaxID=126998 RepID=A0A9W9GIZ9_9EURO|nr:uncharacterized protein N7515_009279 [Penicillium bovifimosum]KAJ5121318.1 hypothetical protein N7515_009279 [Penicillium bovifimosum]
MEAKIPSGPSPGPAQKKQKSDHPMGRILEPIGFYRHPIFMWVDGARKLAAQSRQRELEDALRDEKTLVFEIKKDVDFNTTVTGACLEKDAAGEK